jgi:hypothetical protein
MTQRQKEDQMDIAVADQIEAVNVVIRVMRRWQAL